MYFNKIRHPANFIFADRGNPGTGVIEVDGRPFRTACFHLGGDVHRLTVGHARWRDHGSQAELAPAIDGAGNYDVRLDAEGGLALVERRSNRVLLRGRGGATFGVCGDAWLFQFRREPGMRFFGLGEDGRGLEKGSRRVKFWNTDVVADFAPEEVAHGHPSPAYISMPWLVVGHDGDYVGVLVHNPGAVFMETASDFVWDGLNAEDRRRRSFYLGAPAGRPEIYIIVGPSLAAVIRKFQTLVGRTPLPPLWALGHHQCRWGYAGPRDLRILDRAFRAHGIPCDGLWLDIDYMDRYKVFTFSPRHWRGADRPRRALAALARRGRRVVAILDPGVKAESGYDVSDEGKRRGVFCLSPTGRPFIGFVWPGKTHFPDFSLPHARRWWARRVEGFAKTGFAGAWLDMNDPSVGAVELDDMLFDRGRRPHWTFHNQYALGMARATRAGFLKGRPGARPFLLSRSAFLSSSRCTAVWTGDNVSNWHHLRTSIPLSLSLALSGIPFNGPDVCGFGGDATPALAVAWYKAGFLFPFLRNHSTLGSRAQEPWAFGTPARRVIAHFIRLRYKLLPYLYQLFVAQEETGEAILRPLIYDFADDQSANLDGCSDQFMVGPALMQAPVVKEGDLVRDVLLPGEGSWFSVQTGQWHAGCRMLRARANARETPLYVRGGALIPMQVGERRSQRSNLADIELHCFIRRAPGASRGSLRYVCDDGETFAYRRGARSVLAIEASVGSDGVLTVAIDVKTNGYGPVRLRVVVYDAIERVVVTCGPRTRSMGLRGFRWRFAGRPLAAWVTRSFLVP